LNTPKGSYIGGSERGEREGRDFDHKFSRPMNLGNNVEGKKLGMADDSTCQKKSKNGKVWATSGYLKKRRVLKGTSVAAFPPAGQVDIAEGRTHNSGCLGQKRIFTNGRTEGPKVNPYLPPAEKFGWNVFVIESCSEAR